MYDQYYSLSAEPFRMSPDHRFCYKHTQYAKAMAYMAYAFMRGEGFVLITGNPGTGKTTLVGNLLESLADENVTVGNLVSTQLAADDLLRMVAFSFGIEVEGAEKSLVLQRLTSKFTDLFDSGGRALLIVDEAQDLSAAALEELRLLTNLQKDGKPLLQIFLLGQSELRDLVHSAGLEQVHQRIVAASHLQALREAETRAYVEHRLTAVGWVNDPEISTAVYPVIFKFSEGIPRRINLFCSRLFLHACVERRHRICLEDAKAVVMELQDEQLSTRNLLNDEMFFALDSFDGPLGSESEDLQGRAQPDEVKPEVTVSEVKSPAEPDSETKTPAKRKPKAKSRAKSKAKSASASVLEVEPEPEPESESLGEVQPDSPSPAEVKSDSGPRLEVVRELDAAVGEEESEAALESADIFEPNAVEQVEFGSVQPVAVKLKSQASNAQDVGAESALEGQPDLTLSLHGLTQQSTLNATPNSLFNLDTAVLWAAVFTAAILVVYLME